ncbi:MAG: YggU family protein [Bdellovibrio sp.]|nr:YggU family protein [Bdellovibrio sp.]
MIESIKGGVRLHLFIQPKASKNEVIGLHNGEIKIKITAPPLDGRANEGLIEYLSDLFDIPKRDIHLVKGETGRHKTVDIAGVELDAARVLLKV